MRAKGIFFLAACLMADAALGWGFVRGEDTAYMDALVQAVSELQEPPSRVLSPGEGCPSSDEAWLMPSVDLLERLVEAGCRDFSAYIVDSVPLSQAQAFSEKGIQAFDLALEADASAWASFLTEHLTSIQTLGVLAHVNNRSKVYTFGEGLNRASDGRLTARGLFVEDPGESIRVLRDALLDVDGVLVWGGDDIIEPRAMRALVLMTARQSRPLLGGSSENNILKGYAAGIILSPECVAACFIENALETPPLDRECPMWLARVNSPVFKALGLHASDNYLVIRLD